MDEDGRRVMQEQGVEVGRGGEPDAASLPRRRHMDTRLAFPERQRVTLTDSSLQLQLHFASLHSASLETSHHC